jgi:hypothetical protein
MTSFRDGSGQATGFGNIAVRMGGAGVAPHGCGNDAGRGTGGGDADAGRGWTDGVGGGAGVGCDDNVDIGWADKP